MTICPQCEARNRDDAELCDDCGAPLARTPTFEDGP